jgi:hypothetical protein
MYQLHTQRMQEFPEQLSPGEEVRPTKVPIGLLLFYPVPSHKTLSEAPLRPHFSREGAESFIRRGTVLALHANFEHFHYIRPRGINLTNEP